MPSFDKKKLILSDTAERSRIIPTASIQVSIAMNEGPTRGLKDMIRMASQKRDVQLARPVVGPI